MRSQRTFEAVLKDPMRDVLKSLEPGRTALASLADVAKGQQRTLRQVVDSPIRQTLQSQADLQQLLTGPLADLGRWQDRWAQTTSEQFRGTQQDLVAAMDAGAAEFEAQSVDDEWTDESPQSKWLGSWSAALARWDPAAEQAEELLGVLALIIGLVLWKVAGLPDATAEMLEPLGLLFAAGSLLIHFVRKGS